MAEVWPFKGIQYNMASVGDMSKVIAPPFDVISPEMQSRLHERHEANIVRLILADEKRLRAGANDRYDSARLCLEDWLRVGILAQSVEPAVYLMAQDFELGGRHTRWGFIATIKLEELDSGIVVPHEATMDKPKADRLKLISACEANLSPVFTCYFDSEGKIGAVLKGASEEAPQFAATDDDGIVIRVWKIDDPARLDALHKVMADHQLFIADGHHRYESALNYRNLMREKVGVVKDAPWERVMIYLTDFEDPALLALPIHRSIRHLKGWTPDEFIRELKHSFEVSEMGIDLSKNPNEGLRNLIRVMAENSADGSAIGMVLREKPCPFIIKPLKKALQNITDIPEPLKELDIIQLHRLALGDILEIREKDLRDGEVIVYNHDSNSALNKVMKDGWAAAFFLNRLRVGQIRRVCSAGLRMHQKSTYFYPKIPSGAVIHRLR